MRTVPEVFFKVEKWNSNAGAKAAIDSAWFRIFGLPFEKRTERKVCFVASLVGLPLEVDKVNLKKWEFVRVKIGCKDITKVPAIVEGLLDYHFYDFTFQREVPVEGVTNAAGNTWTRTDRADDDNSSKKPKRDHGKDQQGGEDQSILEGSETKMGDQNHNHQPQYWDQNTQSHQQNTTALGQVPSRHPTPLEDNMTPAPIVQTVKIDKQMGEKQKSLDDSLSNKRKEREESDEDSEDQGLSFDDIISPVGQHLNFGSFQNMEIRNLWTIHLNEHTTAVINEYGSNFIKSKLDPLAAIEAKHALLSGGCGPSTLDDKAKNLEPVSALMTINSTQPEVQKEVLSVRDEATTPSPCHGTQEAPITDWSSQEDINTNLPQNVT